MQQMYWNFLMDLEKFGFASQRRPRMRAFGRSVTRPKDSFSVTFELAAKDDGKVNRQNPIALPRVCVCVSLSVFWRTSSVKVSICSSSNLWYRIPPCFSTWISRAAIFSSSFADCSPVDASVAHKKWIESTSLCPTSLCLVDPAGKFDAHVATSWDSSQLFVICGLQGTSEGRKSNEKYNSSFKSGGVFQRPSCSGHQQNAR